MPDRRILTILEDVDDLEDIDTQSHDWELPAPLDEIRSPPSKSYGFDPLAPLIEDTAQHPSATVITASSANEEPHYVSPAGRFGKMR
ncbi:hypothetical protein MMC21_004011 [Puttea exsequens]|nr:hypothetical protein [Puttea exsequens]